MSIAWREAMSVGDPTVDHDHQHLIELINEFEVAISGAIDHKRIAVVLLSLFEYTAEHFKREEELQLAVRYPYHESHRRSHRDVLKRLTLLVQEYTTADAPVRDGMIRDMAGFLKEWLVDHIIQSDLRMKPYVERARAEKALLEKRRAAAIAQSEHMAAVRG